MSSFKRSQTRKKTKRKGTAKKMTMMKANDDDGYSE
jgi:hypothetical protein